LAVLMNAPSRYRLRGTNFAVARLSDIPRLVLGAAVLMGPAAQAVYLAGRLARSRIAERRWAASVARLVRMQIEIEGIEHIDPTATYVVASLHEGFADVVALLHLPMDLRFVARDELVEWPALGAGLRAGDHVLISPEEPRAALRSLLRAAPEVKAAGDSLVVFPQGSLLGIETAFGRGAFAVAQRTGVAVLPIVVTGSHRVWEHPFSPLVRFGERVVVDVLPPIEPPFSASTIRALERRMKAKALASAAPVRRYRPEIDGFWDGYHFDIDPDFAAVYQTVTRHRADKG
jgi:1-acyl-sn-glycerol-3-phosphate acyltransferase